MENIRKHSMDKYHFLKVLLQLCISVYMIVLGQDTKCVTTGRSAKNCESTVYNILISYSTAKAKAHM